MASSWTPWSRLRRDDEPGPRAAHCAGERPVRSVCVVGAGPSGLVAAKHLKDAGLSPVVYERSHSVGGAFVTKAYDDARLVSSTYLTAFSDLRLEGTTNRAQANSSSSSSDATPSAQPHLPLAQYVAYLQEYAETFGLLPLIRFGTEVTSVRRSADGTYRVTTTRRARATASRAAACSRTTATPSSAARRGRTARCASN